MMNSDSATVQSSNIVTATVVATVILFFSSTGWAQNSPEDDFAKVGQNWQSMLLGYSPDRSNPYIDQRITNLENGASNLLSKRNTSDANKVFDNVNLDDGEWAHSSTYNQLRMMAKAYKHPLSKYHQDKRLRAGIIGGMKQMFNEGYWSDDSDVGNWADKIKVPAIVVDLVMLMYDDLSPKWRSTYAAAIQHHNDLTSYAGNRRDSDAARNSLTQIGVAAIQGNASLMKKAVKHPKSAVYTSSPPGSGHYRDGSYLDHKDHPYNNGSYGTRVLRNLPRILEVIDGTRWDDIGWAKTLYEITDRAYVGAMYDGTLMNAFFGRDLARYQLDVYSKAAQHLHYILRLAGTAPTGVARKLGQRVKYHVQAPDSLNLRKYDMGEKPYLSAVELMNDALTDETLSAARESYAPRVFHNSDRQVIKTNRFAAEISAYSSRVANSEMSNNENWKGWHSGRGMTLLHTSDEQQYIEDMWPTIDWYRLPGTTVVNKPLDDAAYGSKRSSEDWVGGSNLGAVGAFGMSMGPDYTDMSGHKSWLTMAGGQIVCLGAGISNTDNKGPTETTILNRKLNASGDNKFVVDGTEQSTKMGSDTLTDPSWAWLEETGGYYFPDNSDYQVKREERSGQWKAINKVYDEGGTTHKNHFLTVWKNHGKSPTDASYAYVLLPGRQPNEVAAYAKNPPIQGVKNTKTVQAVWNNSQYAGNFWKAGRAGVVAAGNPASVVLQAERGAGSGSYGDKLYVGISDPTHNQSTIQIKIDLDVDGTSMSGGQAKVEDDKDRLSVVDSSGPLVLKVDVGGSHGDTITASFNAKFFGDNP
jgi:hyaluronate lyase